MAALHLAYLAHGIAPGDEVIVPAQTHVATAHAAEWVGATCVFVDPEPQTGNITADGIRAALTERTRAISLVHFLGVPCDLGPIAALAAERGIPLIEDCALAVGARTGGTHVGLHGDVGCFSFYPVKHLTTSEGGMFVTRHADLAERVARLRAFGVDRTHAERSMPGRYEVPALGLNYRMSEPQAALGRSQLRRVDEILRRRSDNFAALRDRLGGRPRLRLLDGPGNSHYCASVVLEGELAARRDDVVAELGRAGVGTSLYYPQPVPRMAYYREKYGYDGDRYANAAQISDCSIALPVGPHLDAATAAEVADALVAAVERVAG
jgi:dTDP-4-amino-4,6-dideoxygalactose transaminase